MSEQGKHTAEPWQVRPTRANEKEFFRHGVNFLIETVAESGNDADEICWMRCEESREEDNARRIVTCVNALAGVANPEAAIPKLVEACRKANSCASLPDSVKELVREALAEVRAYPAAALARLETK